MNLQQLAIKDVKLLTPDIHEDSRGFFLESFNYNRYKDCGIDFTCVQINHSKSVKHTIRGLHFQSLPGQAKIVQVIKGEIFDVAVDIREHSPTFKMWVSARLNDTNKQQLYIPKGFAHGFCVLSEEAEVLYFVDSVYDRATECGCFYLDPDINISWPISNPILSKRDATAPMLKDVLCISGS